MLAKAYLIHDFHVKVAGIRALYPTAIVYLLTILSTYSITQIT